MLLDNNILILILQGIILICNIIITTIGKNNKSPTTPITTGDKPNDDYINLINDLLSKIKFKKYKK